MDINVLLKGVQCSCGRFHACPIQYVYIEEDAALRLKEILKDFRNVLIVSDENTEAAAGERVRSALSGFNVRSVVFPGKTVLVPDEKAIEAVEAELDSVEVLVGIGSGVIQDLCKYVSFDKKIPYCVFATAPSMDGYASNGAAMILKGMKETVAAGLPLAILGDPEVLKDAPIDMIRAGYGDIIGKFSALNDWKLSHCVNDEYFCSYINDLTMEQVRRTMALADGLMKRDAESVRALMEALVIVGILMSFAGSSRPASGSEHHLSHFFEITGIVHNEGYFPHGIDVAYSTVVTARLREKILAHPFPRKIFRDDASHVRAELERIYASSAKGCIALQEKVGNYANDRSARYLEKEQEIRSILEEMPSAAEIEAILARVGYDIKEFNAFYGDAKIRDAVRYAKDLKDRYTVLWINYDFYKGDL